MIILHIHHHCFYTFVITTPRFRAHLLCLLQRYILLTSLFVLRGFDVIHLSLS